MAKFALKATHLILPGKMDGVRVASDLSFFLLKPPLSVPCYRKFHLMLFSSSTVSLQPVDELRNEKKSKIISIFVEGCKQRVKCFCFFSDNVVT